MHIRTTPCHSDIVSARPARLPVISQDTSASAWECHEVVRKKRTPLVVRRPTRARSPACPSLWRQLPRIAAACVATLALRAKPRPQGTRSEAARKPPGSQGQGPITATFRRPGQMTCRGDRGTAQSARPCRLPVMTCRGGVRLSHLARSVAVYGLVFATPTSPSPPDKGWCISAPSTCIDHVIPRGKRQPRTQRAGHRVRSWLATENEAGWAERCRASTGPGRTRYEA